MKRLAATAALAAVTVLALPASPASACSMPSGYLDVGTEPLRSGATVAVSGDVTADANGDVGTCHMPTVPLPTMEPSETAEPEPTMSASGEPDVGPTSPVPTVTLPPLLPVAYSGGRVELWMASAADYLAPVEVPRGKDFAIGTVPATPRRPWGDPKDGLYEYTFSGRVTIPAGLKPGRYEIGAFQEGVVSWGHIEVDVVAGLPETGADTTPLLRLAALSLLTGAGALVAARRVRA